jgi:hypothetical protein
MVLSCDDCGATGFKRPGTLEHHKSKCPIRQKRSGDVLERVLARKRTRLEVPANGNDTGSTSVSDRCLSLLADAHELPGSSSRSGRGYREQCCNWFYICELIMPRIVCW